MGQTQWRHGWNIGFESLRSCMWSFEADNLFMIALESIRGIESEIFLKQPMIIQKVGGFIARQRKLKGVKHTVCQQQNKIRSHRV